MSVRVLSAGRHRWWAGRIPRCIECGEWVGTLSQRVASLRTAAARQVESSADRDWSGDVEGALGGEVGEYCAAMHPANLLVVLDALEGIAATPCSEGDAVFSCTDLTSVMADWCASCRALHALRAVTSSPQATAHAKVQR
jgi:hypothetical protein